MNTARINPYLFVVGAARSGTTLLQRMLDAHPELAVVNETYWVARKFRPRTGLTREGLVTEALLPLLLSSQKFPRMEISEADLRSLIGAAEPVRYDEFVPRIFDLYARRRHKPLAGDKTPGYVRRIPQLHELLPRARFVHIIRDPRDVSLSMVDWSSGERTAGRFGTWELDPLVSSALYWRLSVGLGREAGLALGRDLYHEVRYEDLVSAPVQTLQRLCDFLDLPYADEMMRYHVGKTRIKPGRSSKAQWLPPTPGLRDWRTQLDREGAQCVEVACGPLLVELGYPVRSQSSSDAVRRHVDLLRERFTAVAVAADRTLPVDWST